MFVVLRAAGRRNGIIHQNLVILIGGNKRVRLSRSAIAMLGPASYGRGLWSASLIFLSVLYWLSAYTAQIAAGSKPTSVSCKTKQMTPAMGRPMVKNVSHGSISAMRSRISFLTPVPRGAGWADA